MTVEERARDTMEWFKSSYCADAACVEVGVTGDRVGLRNSRYPADRLVLSRKQWAAFIAGVKAGEFAEPHR